jgi:hypothetical protein
MSDFIDLEESDTVQKARVAKRYISGLGGTETAVLEVPRHGDEGRVIREMAQMGWTYHFTRDAVDKMWFRKADEWDMEPGAGNQ